MLQSGAVMTVITKQSQPIISWLLLERKTQHVTIGTNYCILSKVYRAKELILFYIKVEIITHLY